MRSTAPWSLITLLPSLVSLLSLLLSAACGAADHPATADAATDASPATPDAAPAAPPEYDRLFPTDRVLEVDIAITDADWALLMADPDVDLYVPAALTYDGIVVPQIAIRLKGNSSRNSVAQRNSARYSFKIDTDRYIDGQTLLGIDRLNLNNGFKDPSFLREPLGYAVYRALDVPASRTAFARLTINGALHGLYLVVEQVDKEWLRDRFPDDTGDLLKPEMPSGDLRWRGDTFASYPEIEVKTNEDDLVHATFLHFLDVLNHAAPEELATVMNVDGVLRWLAATTVLVNLDSYAGSGHNYYLYEDRTTGLWQLIPWDVNEAFANFTCGFTPDQLIALPVAQPICGGPGGAINLANRPLIARVLDVPAWRAQYEQYVRDLIAPGAAASPAAIATQVTTLGDLIRPYVAEDPTKFYPTQDFEANLHADLVRPMQTTFGLTSFAERRAADLATQLP